MTAVEQVVVDCLALKYEGKTTRTHPVTWRNITEDFDALQIRYETKTRSAFGPLWSGRESSFEFQTLILCPRNREFSEGWHLHGILARNNNDYTERGETLNCG